MSVVVVNRPPRRPGPALPTGEIILESPPEVPNATGKGWTRVITILPMVAGAAAMGLMMGVGRSDPLTYVAGGLYGVSILGMMAAMLLGQAGPAKREMIEGRRRYLRRLATLRAQVRNSIRQQRHAIVYRHPDPEDLWSLVDTGRLWERRRGDADFGVVRIAVGPQAIATPLVPPQTRPVDELDPLCAVALRSFVTTYSVVPGLPIAIALREFARVYASGPQQVVAALLRAMLAQLTVFHAPDDVLIAVCVADRRRARWEWLKWLPHALHPTKTDAVGPVRLIASSVAALEAMLDEILAHRGRFDASRAGAASTPHVLVIIDGGSTNASDHIMAEGGVDGVTVVDVSSAPPRQMDEATVVLDVTGQGVITAVTIDGKTELGIADELDIVRSEVLVRQLTPLRASATAGDQVVTTDDIGFSHLLGLGDPTAFDVAESWASRPNRTRLRVPIGVDQAGRPVELDLKEPAQDGMGPHGLLVGATGSGKSELLRTIVLALAVTHSSDILNFVLVDFKGGATFNALDRLPHTSAVITNLAEELSLVDRMRGAISGEVTRRQELLRRSGKYASLRDYERARAAGAPLDPLPSMLIICDEFSELLTARPDFIDMFVQIGRVGRSLGIHLLLASQRLDEGRLRGLETHLSYRIGLRTFSSMDSRAVLGVPDAYELPRAPGHGYLKAGTNEMIRFRAAYVSGSHRPEGALSTLGRGGFDAVQGYTIAYVLPPKEHERDEPSSDAEDPAVGETLLDVLVRALEGHGRPAREVWLPPLADPPTLDQVLPAVGHVPQRGLTILDSTLHGSLAGLAGVVDRPFEQRRDPLWLDLSGSAGNVAVVGGPQSGKSSLVRTLLASLALVHTPTETQFYCLDFGGGLLHSLADLPHVGSVASRREVNRVRRTVAELHAVLIAREAHFAELTVDSIATYRQARRQGRYGDDPYGDVFLVIDGWTTMREEFEDLEPMVNAIAGRGLGYGLHLITTANRWMELRPAQRDMFGTKVELRLGDPGDSMINRREAFSVPEQTPGRGLTPDGFHFLGALPRLDGRQRTDDLADAVAELVKQVRAGCPGYAVPPIRLLPKEVPYEALPAPTRGAGGRLPIGIAESDLQPVYLDFDAEPNLLLFGDVESGKSAFLRSLARAITQAYDPKDARIIVVDPRRSLLGTIDSDYVIGYGTSASTTEDLLNQVVTAMRERLPGPDLTPEQLRGRRWWSGPELYLLVDDYDLVAGGMTNPLSPLLDLLSQARDIGLRVVLTRRIGGASRAMYDPVIARIRELAAPGVMLSGPREEGPLFGNIKPQLLPPGRGWLVTRRHGARLVQLAWTPPAR